jgi:hypothetical protein
MQKKITIGKVLKVIQKSSKFKYAKIVFKPLNDKIWPGLYHLKIHIGKWYQLPMRI